MSPSVTTSDLNNTKATCSSSDSDSGDFASVLKYFRREKIPDFASNIRYGLHAPNFTSKGDVQTGPINCRILPKASSGSFHIAFTIVFDDGVKWIIKLPRLGQQGQFDDRRAEALKTEAATMRLIKRKTTIPVPEVFAFNASMNEGNEIGCPYILMEFIEGKPLASVWFQPGLAPIKQARIRDSLLQTLAQAMVQLNQFTSSKGGLPIFDQDGDLADVGSLKIDDLYKQYRSRDLERDHENIDGDKESFLEIGPFQDAKVQLLDILHRTGEVEDPVEGHEGYLKLLRIFIDWAYDTSPVSMTRSFVLSHPDLDSQNILVDDSGELKGIIDWAGVAIVPYALGCQQYPLFLMRDYEPCSYAYDLFDRKLRDDAIENTPGELAIFRQNYTRFMKASTDRYNPVNATAVTQASLVMWTLDIAAKDPYLTGPLMLNLINEIRKATEHAWGCIPRGFCNHRERCVQYDSYTLTEAGSSTIVPSDGNKSLSKAASAFKEQEFEIEKDELKPKLQGAYGSSERRSDPGKPRQKIAVFQQQACYGIMRMQGGFKCTEEGDSLQSETKPKNAEEGTGFRRHIQYAKLRAQGGFRCTNWEDEPSSTTIESTTSRPGTTTHEESARRKGWKKFLPETICRGKSNLQDEAHKGTRADAEVWKAHEDNENNRLESKAQNTVPQKRCICHNETNAPCVSHSKTQIINKELRKGKNIKQVATSSDHARCLTGCLRFTQGPVTKGMQKLRKLFQPRRTDNGAAKLQNHDQEEKHQGYEEAATKNFKTNDQWKNVEEKVENEKKQGEKASAPKHFVDKGRFCSADVVGALIVGDLDRQRTQRLKEGFFALLDQD